MSAIELIKLTKERYNYVFLNSSVYIKNFCLNEFKGCSIMRLSFLLTTNEHLHLRVIWSVSTFIFTTYNISIQVNLHFLPVSSSYYLIDWKYNLLTGNIFKLIFNVSLSINVSAILIKLHSQVMIENLMNFKDFF